MSRLDINSLLERYLKGETSAEENLKIDNWLADRQHPSNPWEQMDAVNRQQWLDEVFADVETDIDKEVPVITMRPRHLLWRVAAAAAILLVGLSLIWQLMPGPAQLTILQTATNEKKQIELSDGSKIWLNARTELKYPQKFAGKTREVFLTGEAYFDIKHDSHKAFIVHTGNLVTTVLGTAFNIKAGQKDNLITVTVTRGKVSVSEGKRLLGFITPNQQISYNKLNKMPAKVQVNAAAVIAWQESDIRFEDITFEDAAKTLTDRFHVKIIFANDQIKSCRFSGAALSGKNIDQILKVLCAFNNATYQHNKDGSIYIKGKGCN